ncbi:MAG: phosphotransferase [Desulfobacula sp.]|nr:phosphotransferase [Desulfobacula sp.]
MKALILAAGFGTRLLPFTNCIPKPMFTLNSIPILEHTVLQLTHAGCDQIIINTHHLAPQIEAFVNQLSNKSGISIDIITIFEPEILDTGGAIANTKPYFKDEPFFVINADVVSTIDFKKVYAFHQQSDLVATLVLHDEKKFNKVGIDENNFIIDFDSPERGLAFTGIQVLSPQIYDYLPDKKIFSSIDLYKTLCPETLVKAFVDKQIFWSDIGTSGSYAMTSIRMLCASYFKVADANIKDISITKLAGDGSDRLWYRAFYKSQSVVVSDHGICMPNSEEERRLNAFINIGTHLDTQNIPASRILSFDRLSGIVLVGDFGDTHLANLIKQNPSDTDTLTLYKKVIDKLIDFSQQGYKNFNEDWTCQTRTYSKELILKYECRYFMDAFIKGFLNIEFSLDDYIQEFEFIAGYALKHGITGLMHRDMQSKNIMFKNEEIFFIDFQSARTGPLQYDLASLLIDPYVGLSEPIKEELLQYTMDKLRLDSQEQKKFKTCYTFCCLTRNLQFLGAFGFLSRVKNKKQFETFIPNAVISLKNIIRQLELKIKLPKLSQLVDTL